MLFGLILIDCFVYFVYFWVWYGRECLLLKGCFMFRLLKWFYVVVFGVASFVLLGWRLF